MTLLGDSIIDSREVIERIEELRVEFTDTPFADSDYSATQLRDIVDRTPHEWFECHDKGNIEELINLLTLQEEAEQYTSEWKDGATLILDDHFEKYTKQQAEDIGDVDRNANWPLNHIDWSAAAEELKQDYTELDPVDGHSYWVRNS